MSSFKNISNSRFSSSLGTNPMSFNIELRTPLTCISKSLKLLILFCIDLIPLKNWLLTGSLIFDTLANKRSRINSNCSFGIEKNFKSFDTAKVNKRFIPASVLFEKIKSFDKHCLAGFFNNSLNPKHL